MSVITTPVVLVPATLPVVLNPEGIGQSTVFRHRNRAY